MKRNCNLELRLVPPSLATASANMVVDEGGSMTKEEEEQRQQLTIFYNGQVKVCDVTEFQARAIIMLASQEMDETTWKSVESSSSPSLQSPLCSPNSSHSMKRSLQRFLQKRQNRIRETSPHNNI